MVPGGKASVNNQSIHSFFPCGVPNDLNEVCQLVMLYVSNLIVLEANVIYCED